MNSSTYNAFSCLIQFFSSNSSIQIRWLENIPNDKGSSISQGNPLRHLTHNCRWLFEQSNTWGSFDDNLQEASDELIWLLEMIATLDHAETFTAHGLKKEISWQLVRRLSAILKFQMKLQEDLPLSYEEMKPFLLQNEG